jgi:hypothetical protein
MPPSGLRPASSPMPASAPQEDRQKRRVASPPVRALSGTPPSALATRVGHAARLENTFGRTPAAAEKRPGRPSRASPPGEQHQHADATLGLQEALDRATAAEAAAKRKDEQIDR